MGEFVRLGAPPRSLVPCEPIVPESQHPFMDVCDACGIQCSTKIVRFGRSRWRMCDRCVGKWKAITMLSGYDKRNGGVRFRVPNLVPIRIGQGTAYLTGVVRDGRVELTFNGASHTWARPEDIRDSNPGFRFCDVFEPYGHHTAEILKMLDSTDHEPTSQS